MNFLKVILLGFTLLMMSLTPGYAKSASEVANTVVTKKTLQNNIANIEKELKSIKSSLDQLDQKKKKKSGRFTSFTEIFFAQVMIYFMEKGEGFKEGILSLEKITLLFSHAYSVDLWIQGGWFFLKFFIACLCGAAAYFLVFQGIQQSLRAFLKWGKRKDLPRFIQLILSAFFFVLPLLAFVLVEMSVFFLNEANQTLRDVAISLTIGGMFLWIIRELTHLLLHHHHPFPLIFPLDKRFSTHFSFWAKGVALFYVIGGWAAEFAGLLGVPESGQKILLDAFGLGWVVCALFLIQTVRRPVMVALAKNKAFLFLRSLSSFWSTLASALIICSYVLWVLDDGYFDLLFWPFLMTLWGIPLGYFLHRELRRLRLSYLWRWRHIKARSPFYNLLASHLHFNRLSKWLIYGGIVYFIFETWGFEFLSLTHGVFSTKLAQQLIDIILVLIFAYMLVRAGDRVLNYYLGKKQTTDSIEADYLAARFHTILKIMRTVLRVGIWVPLVLIILSTFNYDTTPILASVGIITAGLTFGAQSIVKDFLSGFLLILENSLVVGDQVEIDGKSGIVEDLTLRILRVRMDNGTLLTVPFGNISVIGNKSRYFAYTIFNISVGYKEDPDAIQQLLEKAYHALRKVPIYSRKILAPIEIRGIIDVTDYSIVFQARLKTAPGQQDFIKRAFNRVLKQIFDEEGIRIPSPVYPVLEKHGPSLTNTTP